LKREVELFGKNFENYVSEEVETKEEIKKHGKAKQKSTGLKYQFQIMAASGIPQEEIHKFADPTHWIYHFPQEWQKDLKRLGMHVDWRRSFFTTDLNPYYDSFVRWQFNILKSKNKVLFGERYTIFSPVDGQACMDHDRSVGEGVGVQEYTGIKIKLLQEELESEPEVLVKDQPVGRVIKSGEFKAAVGNRDVYLVAATLRPETMYGQTNCYVGVDLEYGVYEVNDKEVWICTHRAARNMSYQNLFGEKGHIKKVFDLKGWDLIGVPVAAPLSFYSKVYVLPMEGVLANKGTGVVTSVPSDSPDDYVTMLDLAKKAAYYHVQESWVKPFLPPKPIIRTANFGDLAAVAAVEKLKINSQKDKKQLAEAKEMVYKDGFYSGTIIVGEYAGKPVQEAKPLIRQFLIDQDMAFAYCEPEGLVVSRSGDECVVAMEPQWYMDYGEDSWKALAKECIENMELYSDDTRNQFLKNLDWLKQWACSRRFGLGTRLPWDKEWLIESLSDSTIYMAYYTVAHILHEGTLDGSKPSKYNILPEDMTDDVWSYILLDGPLPMTRISKETLELMKKEFNYFYPLDLRTSGKDLINNHLTFFIYNHTAIFPKEKWPRGIRPNGHLLLNNEKMAKSTGNFLTLRDALTRYGADATRFALADAGDALEDANFLEKTADDAILKLYTEREFIEESLADDTLRSGEWTWNDKVFDAEINSIIDNCKKAYDHMMFREAIKTGFYELQNARNEYRKATTGNGLTNVSKEEKFENMHIDLIKRFATIQALVLSPITPHWSESIWKDLLGKVSEIHVGYFDFECPMA
jgi:leucyl-tRNA synthetase